MAAFVFVKIVAAEIVGHVKVRPAIAVVIAPGRRKAVAVVVLVQAAGAHRYVWMSLFLLAACLFNPIVPLELSHQSFMAASILTALLFFFSIELLQPKARLSNASMTGRRPGSESL